MCVPGIDDFPASASPVGSVSVESEVRSAASPTRSVSKASCMSSSIESRMATASMGELNSRMYGRWLNHGSSSASSSSVTSSVSSCTACPALFACVVVSRMTAAAESARRMSDAEGVFCTAFVSPRSSSRSFPSPSVPTVVRESMTRAVDASPRLHFPWMYPGTVLAGYAARFTRRRGPTAARGLVAFRAFDTFTWRRKTAESSPARALARTAPLSIDGGIPDHPTLALYPSRPSFRSRTGHSFPRAALVVSPSSRDNVFAPGGRRRVTMRLTPRDSRAAGAATSDTLVARSEPSTLTRARPRGSRHLQAPGREAPSVYAPVPHGGLYRRRPESASSSRQPGISALWPSAVREFCMGRFLEL